MTKRVLHILNDLRPSGAEVMLRAAAKVWADRDIAVEILSTGDSEGTFAESLREAGYLVWHIPFANRGSYVKQLIALVRDRHIDVIHVHSERVAFLTCTIARLVLNVRAVRTIHSTFRFAGLVHFKIFLQRRILSMLGVVHAAIAEGVAQNELERYANQTRLAYNWYDNLRFFPPSSEDRTQARRSIGLDASNFVIATVGNCAPVKNHSALIQAIAKILASQSPRTHVLKYLHIGEEDSGNSEQKLVQELGIGGHVVFLGRTANPERYLQAADLYVMPSLYEGFGIAVLEALAMGIPVLLTDVPGLRDFRMHFASLNYCDPDTDSLAGALLEIMDDRFKALLTHKQSVAAAEKFSIAAGTSGYARLYE